MGKRSESRLTIDGWDTFSNMKFNGGNENGWSFPGHTAFGIEDAAMLYVLKKVMGCCLDKVAAMEFNPEFELSPKLIAAELIYLIEMVQHPV